MGWVFAPIRWIVVAIAIIAAIGLWIVLALRAAFLRTI
jgi:hypothetical protein